MTSAARKLAADHPELCRLRQVGESRAGTPLLLLTVGCSEDHVLVVAGAHANEPAGGATIVALAQRAVAEPAGVTWDFLLCLDPDGARLIGRGGSELADNFREFFRPAAEEQPEWAPSIGVLLPESRALLDVIEEVRPFLQISLHNTEVGGAFLQATRDLPGLAEAFGQATTRLGIALDLGPYDTLYWPSPGPGVYLMPPFAETARSASASWAVGTTTWHAPSRYGGVTTIVEVPLWTSARVADPTPVVDPDGYLVAMADRLRHRGLQVGEFLMHAEPILADGPLLRSVRGHLAACGPLADEWDPRVSRPGPPQPPLTAARLAGLEAWAYSIPLRAAAMLRRLLDPVPPGLAELIARWCTEYQAAFRPTRVPLARQVELQVLAVQQVLARARPQIEAGR